METIDDLFILKNKLESIYSEDKSFRNFINSPQTILPSDSKTNILNHRCNIIFPFNGLIAEIEILRIITDFSSIAIHLTSMDESMKKILHVFPYPRFHDYNNSDWTSWETFRNEHGFDKDIKNLSQQDFMLLKMTY